MRHCIVDFSIKELHACTCSHTNLIHGTTTYFFKFTSHDTHFQTKGISTECMPSCPSTTHEILKNWIFLWEHLVHLLSNKTRNFPVFKVLTFLVVYMVGALNSNLFPIMHTKLYHLSTH